jgi:hypothetical protein
MAVEKKKCGRWRWRWTGGKGAADDEEVDVVLHSGTWSALWSIDDERGAEWGTEWEESLRRRQRNNIICWWQAEMD